jgi:NhaP-type Na+/H+ or K+/H+ antiporter
MEHLATSDPALTVALALLAGIVAQSLAHHLRLPGIVLLLGVGVLLGPDGIGLVQPRSLGSALATLVNFAVAVILFEGGLNLDLRRLRREATTIRRLVILGSLITGLGAAVTVRMVMGWDWILSLLLGSLVIVTGPTVINPLLRRIKVKSSVATVLEAEGVLIDPVGAFIAVLALEAVLRTANPTVGSELANFGLRLGLGVLMGLAGGLLLAFLLRFHRLVPESMQNVMVLSVVLALFQVSDWLLHESGILSVTVAGMVVGNLRSQSLRELQEFKEQLTMMFIGMLFVLLAADVRVAEVQALGWPGVVSVMVLMMVVRPVNVAVCTWGSSPSFRERFFLAGLAPRGIVAAAMATLFAQSLSALGIPGGQELRALVFMVIAMTVLLQGLSGGLLAHLLGLRRPSGQGYVILGANGLARALGGALLRGGEEVVLVDANPTACRAAQEDGFRVVFGNALEERTLLRAELDTRAACAGSTPNEEVNLLFVQRIQEEFKVPRSYLAMRRHGRALDELVSQTKSKVIFGGPQDLNLWSVRLSREDARVEAWRRSQRKPTVAEKEEDQKKEAPSPPPGLIPLVRRRGGRTVPVEEGMTFREDDLVEYALLERGGEEAAEWLRGQGWVHEVEQEAIDKMKSTGEGVTAAEDAR